MHGEKMDTNQKFVNLHQTLMALSHGTDLLEHSRLSRLKAILSSSAKELSASRVSIWHYNPVRDRIHCELLYIREQDAFESGAELLEVDYPSYFQAVAESRVIDAVYAKEDPRTCEFTPSYLAPLGIESMLDAPIFAGGCLSGVICIEQTGAPRQWDIAELSYVTAVADTISLINKHEEWIESTQKAEWYDRTDSLTNLENRRYFHERIQTDLERYKDPMRTRAMVVLGVDNFTEINDSHGTNVADEVLVGLASRFQEMSQAQHCLLGRVGGDIFGFWVPVIREENQLDKLIGEIYARLNEPIALSAGKSLDVSASVGVFIYPQNANECNDPIRCAEVALKQAKTQRRGSTAFFSEDWMKQLQARREQEQALLEAFEQDQLCAFYQPIFCAETKQMAGMEALVRWQHPQKGLIPPFKFLPLVAEMGLMSRLGSVMLRRACADMQALRQSGAGVKWVSVNLAADQLYDTGLVLEIENLLAEFDLPAAVLELEIVEELISRDSELVRAQLLALSDLGIRLSIDDFGTGFSSLSRLKYLPVSKIKIDKSFVDGLPDSEDDQCIAQAIIGLAHGMALDLVAEGVEYKSQEAWLLDKGCQYIQGYLYAKPMPYEDLLDATMTLGNSKVSR